MSNPAPERPVRLNSAVGGTLLLIFGVTLAVFGFLAPVVWLGVTGCIMAAVGIAALVAGMRKRSVR